MGYDGPKGAKVLLINSDTDSLIGTTTTGYNGHWTYDVPDGINVAAVFQHDDGDFQYNTTARPYLNIPSAPDNGYDSFESDTVGNSPSQWDDQNAEVVNSYASDGSQSCRNYFQPAFGNYAIRRTGLAASPADVVISYRETSNSGGFTYKLLNGSGNAIFKVGSGNPQVEVVSGNGGDELISQPSPNYEEWRRFSLTLDWANNSFDVTWSDLTGNENDITRTSKPFINNSSSVSEAWIGTEDLPNTNGEMRGYEWIDNVWGGV